MLEIVQKRNKEELSDKCKEYASIIMCLEDIGLSPTADNLIVYSRPPELSKNNFIVMPKEYEERERKGTNTGILLMIGPTAYVGWEGVRSINSANAAKEWGVEIGDSVEFNRYAADDIALLRDFMVGMDSDDPARETLKYIKIIKDVAIKAVIKER